MHPEHVKYGGFDLALYLSVAFTIFLRHSYVQEQFLTSYVVSVGKDKSRDTADMNNYQGISVSSVVSKVLETVLLGRVRRVLRMSDQKFGFKRGRSCADCSFVLKTTIDHYMKRGNTNMMSILWICLKLMTGFLVIDFSVN